MSNHASFAVPKDRQEVAIRLLGGDRLEGAIFLEYASADLTLLQKVTAFLEGGNAFFPLRLNAGGETEFINKDNVWIVELAYSADAEKDSLALRLMYSVGVTVIFANNDSISGTLLAEVPLERARLSDSLNLPHRFVIVRADGKICYVNKKAIRKVVYADKA